MSRAQHVEVLESADEVLSGEAVAIEVQPVGLLLRTLGALIDMLVAFAIFAAYLVVRYWVLGALGDPALDRILAVLALVTAFVLVPCAVETITHGRSIGRLAVGRRIVRVDGGAAGFRQALIRSLIGVLEIYATFGALAFLTAAFNARSQRLGDLVAGTYSQRVRTPPLPYRVPVLPPGLEGWAAIADVARMPDRLARRIAQFLENATRLDPGARARVVPAEAVLTAASVLRRQRERRGLALADERVERLSGTRVGL